jgi:hypothetical protein
VEWKGREGKVTDVWDEERDIGRKERDKLVLLARF